jgi:SAM-dependent methyltransferase
MSASLHQKQILNNLQYWEKKPLLRRIYRVFYRLIAQHLSGSPTPKIVELGSGIGNIKEAIPTCLRTDLFPNPWIDQIENAYALSFADNSVSDLILFDVFHHLRFPGTVLQEFWRVLQPRGRVIIFDPCISLLGMLVYGVFHPEPVHFFRTIEWLAPPGWSKTESEYYAAQGYATRIFTSGEFNHLLGKWDLKVKSRLSAISYIASGGYSGPQIIPDAALPVVQSIEPFCDLFPFVFATRLLVVLQKPGS